MEGQGLSLETDQGNGTTFSRPSDLGTRRLFLFFDPIRKRGDPGDHVAGFFDTGPGKRNLLKGKGIFELEFGVFELRNGIQGQMFY